MSGLDTRCRSIVLRLSVGVLAASALALAGAAADAHSAANGLVAAYAFDEGAGRSVADASGNRNKGTISGAAWTWSGRTGAGMAFDGIDDLVTIPGSASLDLTGAMTLEAWVQPSPLGSPSTAALLKERPGGLAYGLYGRSGAQGPGAAVHNGVTETRTRALLQVPNGFWSHVAATYDGTTLRLYVNGAELASSPAPGGIAASASPLRLGGSSVTGDWFAGTLDDVRIYSRALSGAEIAADMVTPVPGPGPDTTDPSTPTGLRATRRTQTTIDLFWDASTDDRGVAGYDLYADKVRVASSSTTSATLGRLSCGRTYQLAVDAVDEAGNRSDQATLTAATLACPDTMPPSAPTGLVRTGSTQTSITVSWNAAIDDRGIAEYGVYQGTAKVAGLGAAARTHTFAGLACGTSYALGVDAADAAGNRSTRATLTASTSACPDTAAPSTPTGLRVTGSSPTSVSLSWVASTDDVGVTGYALYVEDAAAGTRTGTSATLSALTCGRTYTVGVEAYDAAGNRSGRATLPATTRSCTDTTVPTTPTGLQVTGRTATSVSLSWTASTDDVAVTGYGLYADDTASGSSTTTTGTVTELACGRTYALGVDAYDGAGNRSGRATVSASTNACPDTTPPSTPTDFTQTASTQSSVTVSWDPAGDNVGVTEHGLYRDGTRVATVGGSASSHTFSGLTCGSSYLLGIDAADAAGNRSGRASASGTTAACASGGGSASVFLSPAGSDSNPCSQTAPCKTLARGFRAAAPGAVVEMAAGTYAGQQEIPDAPKSGSADVLFRPAPGANVVIESLDVYGAHVVIEGVRISRDFYAKCGADDVTLRNSKAMLFFIRPATNVSMIDVEFGPSKTISQMGSSGDCATAPNNVLMERVYMHDFWWSGSAQSSVHMECLTVEAADNLTIRNSRFHRCEDFDILFKHRGAVLASTGITLENNWFGRPWPDGTSAIQFSEPAGGGRYSNLLIRNNSWAATLTMKSEVSYVNARVIANVGTRFGGTCSQVTSAYNVWSGTPPCSSTDDQAPTDFVDQDGFDLHLRPGAAAIDHGDPTSFPAFDIDGEARPRGAAPDAGADEAAVAGPTGTSAATSMSTIAPDKRAALARARAAGL